MKTSLILACLLMALSFFISCSDDDDDKDHATQDLDCEGDVCTDSRTNLMWQAKWFEWAADNWYWARNFCDDLSLAGYEDWRLPTISELRSLVQGCDDTATGGACNVTDSCLESSCENPACDGCIYGEGPNGGCFGASTMPGECYGFWSMSKVSDYEESAWYISFREGSISCGEMVMDGGEHRVRCVRDVE